MALNVTFDMTDINKYSNLLKVAGDRFLPEIDKAVYLTANESKVYVTGRTPKITGNLRRGFQVQKLGMGTYLFYNLVKYFMWIETGERKGKGGKTVVMKAPSGGYHMVENSIQNIRDRLAFNIGVSIDFLMNWRRA